MYGNETADPGAAYWTAVVLQCIAPTTPLLNVALFFRANLFLLFPATEWIFQPFIVRASGRRFHIAIS